MQNYYPYRKNLLDKNTLSRLYTLQPIKVIIPTLFSWLIIVICWFYVARNTESLLIIFFAILIIQTQVYSLLIIAHDGLHRRLFYSTKNNDIWNDFFILGSIGIITEINRTNHMNHHKCLSTLDDPDRFKYIFTGRSNESEFIKSIFCVGLISTAIKNVLYNKQTHGKIKSYKLRDIFILCTWQILLITLLTLYIRWWAYPLLWLVPCAIAVCFDLVRVFCEHSEFQENDSISDSGMRLHSFESNFLERIFFSPHNMNCHIAHHLWPAIPFYNLRKAEKILKKELKNNDFVTWRKGYLDHLGKYYLWIKKV